MAKKTDFRKQSFEGQRKKLFNWRTRTISNSMRVSETPFLPNGKSYFYTDHQALETLIKRNRCNKQYSSRIERWLDQLAYFDISIQHIARNNLKFTDFTSWNPVESAETKNIYDGQHVNIVTEQPELNLKFGRIFTTLSQHVSNNKVTHESNLNNQSEASRKIENNRDVDKLNELAETSRYRYLIKLKRRKISQLPYQQKSPLPSLEKEMVRDYFHWGATAEVMGIIRRREKSLETKC